VARVPGPVTSGPRSERRVPRHAGRRDSQDSSRETRAMVKSLAVPLRGRSPHPGCPEVMKQSIEGIGVADVRACAEERGAVSDELQNFGAETDWPLPRFFVNVAAEGDKV